jgi:uncharacterized protein YkwD
MALPINSSESAAEELVKITNIERSKQGLSQLKVNSNLNDAALNKARDMLNNNYWAHISPTGKTAWEFINNSGYNYEYAGENLVRGYSSTRVAFDALMQSEEHRKNILSLRYSEIGVAVVETTYNHKPLKLIVQLFARPTPKTTLVVDSFVRKLLGLI